MYHAPNELCEAMGQKGRRYFEQHFEMNKLLKQFEIWISELTTGKLKCEY